ncbi:MAG: hypothetical protein OIN66_17560, partial [Candidatus Methanoperedens sp.]|nr:hypothetical protein [Candidatus Methanoperedens sp.]
KITVSDAPQLFRNVFVQESEGAPAAQENPIVKRLKENPLKVSAVIVFMLFGVTLYYLRRRLFEDITYSVDTPVAADKPKGNILSGTKEYLASKIQSVKKVIDKKPKP